MRVPGVNSSAHPPKVTVLNNIFPPHNELRNCTTCGRGRKLPADATHPDQYHYHCTFSVKGGFEHIGARYLDNSCEYYIRKRRSEQR